MKNLYGKLKSCENYNILILAVLAALTARAAVNIFVSGTSAAIFLRAGAGGVFAAFGVMILMVAVTTALAIWFVVQACRKDPKFMIGAFAVLAVAFMTGTGHTAVQCLIICIYWFWMVIRKPAGDIRTHVKRLIIILFCISIAKILIYGILNWTAYGFETWQTELAYISELISFDFLNPEFFLLAYLYKGSESRIFKGICWVIAAFWVLMVLNACMMVFGSVGYWSEWGPASMEEGDWEGWSTEEDAMY